MVTKTILFILLVFVCLAPSQEPTRRNGVGLIFSNVDPLGLAYNRVIPACSNGQFEIGIGLLPWEIQDHPSIMAGLRPGFGWTFLNIGDAICLFSTGMRMDYELEILNDRSSNHNAYPGSKPLPYNNIDSSSQNDTGTTAYKYSQKLHLSPFLGLRMNITIYKAMQLVTCVALRSHWHWIIDPDPALPSSAKRFYWDNEISLGCTLGLLYLF